MRLRPLKLRRGADADTQIKVMCRATRAVKKWNDAVLAGWCADLDGQPFNAYYSPEGVQQITQPQP